MKVLVCGGRKYDNKAAVYDVLDRIHEKLKITSLVHGGAKGADSLADEWAFGKCETVVYLPDWDIYGRSAGSIRNQQMLDNEKIELVIAFPGGPGTQDMITRACKAGIKTLLIREK